MAEDKVRVLYVSQEINPFLPEGEISTTVKAVAKGVQEDGKEIRAFMPRFGCINERRHQLHEVIRLSGMNLIIDDTDHPLIIKVASIPQAKMQVYFIDNEGYFKRKATYGNEETPFFEDNDERSMFFCRGVLETVKKLGWTPDVIHCSGWMTALMPMYIKKYYADDPHFNESKVVFSVYNDSFDGSMNEKLSEKMKFDNFSDEDVSLLKEPTYENLCKTAVNFSDAVIISGNEINSDVNSFIQDSGKLTLAQNDSDEIDTKAYSEFYDKVLEENSVLAD